MQKKYIVLALCVILLAGTMSAMVVSMNRTAARAEAAEREVLRMQKEREQIITGQNALRRTYEQQLAQQQSALAEQQADLQKSLFAYQRLRQAEQKAKQEQNNIPAFRPDMARADQTANYQNPPQQPVNQWELAQRAAREQRASGHSERLP